MSTQQARHRRDEALRLFGWTFEQVFSRNTTGRYLRTDVEPDDRVRRRVRVWRHMRTPRGGVVLSYPEIAAVSNGCSHTAVLKAMRKKAPKFSNGAPVGA